MANLNKLLVHVPSNLCDGFKTKYVNGTDRSYDNKVVFLEKTQEIFTQGKLYGTNIEDFSALKELVGTIPSGATSTNIVAYISEMISNADHIHSVSKKSGENLIDVTTSNKDVTINSTSTLTTAVSNAKSAMQSVSVLGKTLNKTTTSISVAEAKTALGLGTAAYKNAGDFDASGAATKAKEDVIGKSGDDKGVDTIFGAKAYADNAASTAAAGVVAKLPVVTNGSGIVVTPNTDSNGKTTYTVSTSAEVFHYKGNKTTKEQLPTTGNTTGDVWSVGPVDAAGSILYAWDGDEWINIGSADGITGVDTTPSSGVELAKNTNGTVKVNVKPGSIADGNGSVVTGGAVYTAISAAEGRCDAKGTAKGLIDKLGGSKTSSNGTYVNVTVTTSKGEVSGVTVSETANLTSAITKANSAMQSVTILGHKISNGGSVTVEQAKADLQLGSAAHKDSAAFDAAGTAQGLIDNLGGSATSSNGTYVNVKVDTSKGQASNVTVTETDALKTAVTHANSAVQTIPDSTYLSATKTGTTVNLNLDETKVFNYVSNNIWETYSV